MNGTAAAGRARRIDALFAAAPVVPVIRIDQLEHAVPLAETLVAAGLATLEITLRTAVALEAIERIAAHVPGAVVGAGTVLSGEDLHKAASAGAQFAIAPGTTANLYQAARQAEIPFLPAVATASEIMTGLEFGHRRFKFFPAQAAGGVETLRAWQGPFSNVAFVPTGGIDAARAPDYLQLDNVLAVGGSWMVPAAAVDSGDLERIARLARDCARLR